jgi:hypothetical protein
MKLTGMKAEVSSLSPNKAAPVFQNANDVNADRKPLYFFQAGFVK